MREGGWADRSAVIGMGYGAESHTVPGHPTYLNKGRARTCCTCSRVGGVV